MKNDKCDCCYLNYFIVKSMKKSGWVCCQKYKVLKHEIRVSAKGKRHSFVVDATVQNCKTKWMELCLQKYIFWFFIITILYIFLWKNQTFSSSYTRHVSALTLYLVHIFYTVKHVLSEMTETVPPCIYWATNNNKTVIYLLLFMLKLGHFGK